VSMRHKAAYAGGTSVLGKAADKEEVTLPDRWHLSRSMIE
jgi:hypothetical protein